MVKHRSLAKLIKNEYVFSIITKFINIGLGIIQSVLVARFLGAELRGVNAYISSITSIGAIVITFGMHQAYPYFRKKYGKDAIYRDYVSLTILLYSIYMVAAILLVILFPFSIEAKAAILLIPLLGYSRVTAYITLIEQPNLRNTWWTVIQFVDVLYVFVLWLFVKRNVYWGISILFFADLLKCVVYTLMLKVKPHFKRTMYKMLVELAKFGFFPMLALLMTTLNYRIDVLMLHGYDYITDSMIGVYSLGLSLSDKIVMIPDTLKGILVSKLSKGASDHEVAKVSRISFWASVFFCILIFAFGQWVIDVLYGAEYTDAYSIILITATGILVVSYFKFIAQYNIVNKKQFLNVAMLSIAIIADVVLNLLFIPIWGINGAAFATSIGNAVCGVVFILYFCKCTGIHFSEMIVPQKEDIKMLMTLFNKKV